MGNYMTPAVLALSFLLLSRLASVHRGNMGSVSAFSRPVSAFVSFIEALVITFAIFFLLDGVGISQVAIRFPNPRRVQSATTRPITALNIRRHVNDLVVAGDRFLRMDSACLVIVDGPVTFNCGVFKTQEFDDFANSVNRAIRSVEASVRSEPALRGLVSIRLEIISSGLNTGADRIQHAQTEALVDDVDRQARHFGTSLLSNTRSSDLLCRVRSAHVLRRIEEHVGQSILGSVGETREIVTLHCGRNSGHAAEMRARIFVSVDDSIMAQSLSVHLSDRGLSLQRVGEE